MKIVLIGAGSYVFAPTVLRDALAVHKLQGVTLAMVDCRLEAAEAMAAFGRRLAQVSGVKATITAHSDRRAAMPGADVVILSAAIEGQRRYEMDRDVLVRHGLGDQARECGGLGGLMYSLRSIGLALDVAADMETLCPSAVLLDVTNPLPRVVTAVNKYSKIRCYGFCSAALRGDARYGWLSDILGKPAESLDVATAGLNHIAWHTWVRDRATGEDLLPQVVAKVRPYEDPGTRLSVWLYDEYGMFPAGYTAHQAEFLPPMAMAPRHDASPFHGNPEERRQRWQDLADAAAGKIDWQRITEHGSWEHPIDVAVGLVLKQPTHVMALNLVNDGCLPSLPIGRVVEVPADVIGGEVKGRTMPALSSKVAALLRSLSDVHELVAQSAATGDVAVARRSIEIDPAVVDKPAGLAAFDEMLPLHRDVLARFK